MFEDQQHYNEVFLENEGAKDLREKYFVSEYYDNFNKYLYPNPVRFTREQVTAICRALTPGLQLVIGPPGTGKTDICVEMARQLLLNFPNEKIIIITHSNAALNDIFEKVYKTGVIQQEEIVRLGAGEKSLKLDANFSKNGRINHLLEKRIQYLAEVKKITQDIGLNIDTDFTCETAEIFFMSQIKSRWDEFNQNLKKNVYDLEKIQESYPFTTYVQRRNPETTELFPIKSLEHVEYTSKYYYESLKQIFKVIRDCRFLELLRNGKERGKYLVNQYVKVVAMTVTHSILKHEEFLGSDFQSATVIFEEAGQLLDFETISVSTFTKGIKRMILLGDDNQLPPIVKNKLFQNVVNLQQSLFVRLLRLEYPLITLVTQGRSRPEILELFKWKYEK